MMTAPADFTDESAGALRFSGSLTLARLGDLPNRLRDYQGDAKTIDLSGIDHIDTVGAWVVHRFADEHGAAIEGLDEDGRHLLDQVANADQPVAVRPTYSSSFTRVLGEIGDAVVETGRTLYGLLGFLGATVIAFANVVRHPRRFRFNATVHRFEVVGVSALAIIGLMSFLIGIVIAQQGAVQLEQFGLEVFTINLVGRASIRELGLLMTAIMVAGRSGSAFAAQIGTMKLTEEIDAMRTIGVSPMEAIVLPRVAASTITMPLLGFYASICAIIGGGVFCWAGLEIPPLTYVQRLREIIPMHDFWIMLIKAPVFGILIGVTGCYEGMQVRQNAEEVGKRTTSAVVAAIFLVIVLDAFFAVFFSSLGWN